MIVTLRRRHRAVFVALAVLLPVLVALALAARRAMPVVEALPPELAAEAAGADPAE